MEKIILRGQRIHSKASEKYVDVTFNYDDGAVWDGSVPIEYRRTGTNLTEDEAINNYIAQVYDYCHPSQYQQWKEDQQVFWEDKIKATITKSFFEPLTTFKWTCISCQLPNNPNWARRIQDLKEMGYTIATSTARYCSTCSKKNTHLILLPLLRGGISGYETWSPTLRKRIIRLLQSYDAYEGKIGNKDNLLPDHKFPEIRWENDTRRDSLEHLTNDEILEQFQLMSNQRNQQKREVCRQCSQSNKRGYPFGIKYYYQGGEEWDKTIPTIGKEAEQGCVGCGWYDFEVWRNSLNKTLDKFQQTISDLPDSTDSK